MKKKFKINYMEWLVNKIWIFGVVLRKLDYLKINIFLVVKVFININL